MITTATRTTVLMFLCLFSVTTAAQESESADSPAFGGPGSVENQMADEYESWDDWKKKLKDDPVSLSASTTRVSC